MAETTTAQINSFQVRLGGEAGQGVESGGAGFARAVMRAGLHCFGLQDYMSRIRGGHNFYQIRVNEAPLYTFDDTLHLLLAFNRETAIWIFLPVGLDQSSGTGTNPHSAPTPVRAADSQAPQLIAAAGRAD